MGGLVREGGDGTGCTSKWLCFCKCAESSSEDFLTSPKEPESTFSPLPLSFKPTSGICAHKDVKNGECSVTDVSPLKIND